MSESLLPPVVFTLGADLAGFATGLQESVGSLTDFGALVQETSAVVTEACAAMGSAVEEMATSVSASADIAKTGIRQIASAARALTKAVGVMAEAAPEQFTAVSAAAQAMAADMEGSLTAAKASVAEIGTTFTTAATEATTAATEMTTAATESTTAATKAGEASAASAEESSTALGGTAGALSKYVLGLAATGVGIFEAVKGATTFNGAITQLNTQAGVSKSQLAGLGDGVLKLAGQVGQSPDSLAEALFHVESNFASLGITAPKALDLVKVAAEGATVGHADLVDVTNALTAAVASGIPGVENMGQAMGQLNAIVGSGDMKMQDLADAFGTGMVATVKGFGLSLTDVGAALATFGDNNIRGAKAGTDLRMTVQALAQPAKSAGVYLEQFGMTQNTLAQDMQKGGLKLALQDLQKHFEKAGITADQQGQVITDMFGKKAGTGLNILMGQMDRFQSKYPAITDGANNFAGAWATASHTAGVEFDQLKGSLEALGIKIGEKVLPYVTKLLGWIQKGISWVTQHKAAMEALAGVIGGVLLTAVVSIAGAVLTMEAPFTLAEVAIAAVAYAVFYAYTHFKTFRTVVDDVASFLKGAFKVAWHAAGDVIDWFRTTVIPGARKAIAELVSWFNAHKAEFSEAWKLVLHDVETVVHWFNDNVIKWVQARVGELVAWWKAHSAEISEVWKYIWKVVGDEVQLAWGGVIKPVLETIVGFWNLAWGLIKDTFKLTWSILSDAVTTGMHLIENIIGVVLDIVTGHWGQAWKDLKKLVSDGFNDVTKFLSDVTSNFGTLLLDAGKNLIDGLIKGIKAGAGGISSAVGGVAKTVRDFFPFSPAKTGPLSGSGSMDIAGAKVGSMLAAGMHSSVGVVAQASQRLAGTAGLAGSGQLALVGPGSSALPPSSAGSSQLTASPLTGAGSAPVINNYFNIEGSVMTENQLVDVVQKGMLRIGMRSSTTYQNYARR